MFLTKNLAKINQGEYDGKVETQFNSANGIGATKARKFSLKPATIVLFCNDDSVKKYEN
jgi:hypothetical protein